MQKGVPVECHPNQKNTWKRPTNEGAAKNPRLRRRHDPGRRERLHRHPCHVMLYHASRHSGIRCPPRIADRPNQVQLIVRFSSLDVYHVYKSKPDKLGPIVQIRTANRGHLEVSGVPSIESLEASDNGSVCGVACDGSSSSGILLTLFDLSL